MSRPRFVPFACGTCGGRIDGRSVDRVAFCAACDAAFRCDGERLEELAVRSVTELPSGDGPVIALPFWWCGPVVAPAFLTVRALTLTRVASELISRWRLVDGLATRPARGARLAPSTVGPIATLVGMEPPADDGPLGLLAVPARLAGRKMRLPGWSGALYPGDVVEAESLAALAEPGAARAR